MIKKAMNRSITTHNHIGILLASFLMISLISPSLSWSAPPVDPRGDKPPLFGGAERQKEAGQNNNAPVARQIGEGIIQLGNIHINKKLRIVSVRGTINQATGEIRQIATAAAARKNGSLLVVDTDAQTFQTALIMADILPGNTQVGIWVTWADASRRFVKRAVGELVRQDPKTKADEPFVFDNPHTLIDQELPQKNADAKYIVEQHTLPGKGTPITLVVHDVRPLQKPGPMTQ